MDMIRWLASNIVVQVAWGLGLLAVLLAALFGGGNSSDGHAVADTHATVEKVETAEATTEPEAVVAAVAVAATAVTATTEVEPVQALVEAASEETEVTEEVAEVAEPETVAAEEAVAETAAVEAPVADEVVSEEVIATEEAAPVVTEEAAATEDMAAVTEDVATAEATEETTLDTGSVEDKSSDDLLMMAREAYWNNGLDEAAELYGVLIEREPTVIEHKGELGNVFWRQGYPKKAAELYAEIAEPMIEKGNGERVSNMVGFIGLFFPERATAIRELLAK